MISSFVCVKCVLSALKKAVFFEKKTIKVLHLRL